MSLPRLVLVLLLSCAGARAGRVEFNRDVRPILSENCFKCHGFDAKERKADLRLDTREGALAENDGYRAVVPGDLKASELWQRLLSTDPDEQMPPPKSGKHLTDRNREVLKTWIEQGAEYQPHWSYLAPRKAPLPAGAAHPVDAFVGQRLQVAGLTPSPEADKRTLIRRLSLDLLGLPPSPEQVEAFVKDERPEAYAALVERLLASPQYGERMAMPWLDVVRYADTIGYHSDNPRNVWPYRDYVIAAFNANKPFDQFTIEQLAGDLLPNATRDQQVASCFNRLVLSTEEGGAQAKDYEQRMLTDRVRAVGTIWLGATIGCAQCHDHKFDPITQRDFYTLGAFFADLKEPVIGKREAGLSLGSPEQEEKLQAADAKVAAAQKALEKPLPGFADEALAWSAQLSKKQVAELPRDLRVAGGTPVVFQTAYQRQVLRDQYRKSAPRLAAERKELEKAEAERKKIDEVVPRVLVSIHSDKERTVRILPRGDWMNETGEIVQATLPRFLPNAPAAPAQKLTRLDLAHWLVSRENPLTARVFVNRVWKQFFGTGLSKVLDDLGAQGEPPLHAELLDWLAVDFMESGWDVKHLVRVIVTSRAYRQVSTGSKELLARDPYNRELARQSRWRLDAELVRDSALAASGLLVEKVGGPSVRPYQPAGYWENLNFPQREWDASPGADQYRRGLYTWWQRSYLHPSLLAFDAPTREECAAERVRSNIPQQALVLLNDPTYVEAARALALRILRENAGADTTERLRWAFQQTLQRAPRADELDVLSALYAKELAAFEQSPESAHKLLGKTPDDLPLEATAAWTSVARALLNLHETITRS